MVRIIQRNSVLLPILKWMAFAVTTVIALVACLALVYLVSTQNSPSGSQQILGLNDAVNISFDASDIPHIKAATAGDALFALGYLHATERSWQMEINRRLAAGRLSEILGEDTLKIDRFIRTVGVKHSAERH